MVTKGLLKKITKEKYKIQSRMNDVGSKISFAILKKLKTKLIH